MIKVGIIGTGSFAHMHAQALESLGDRVRIVGAASPNYTELLEFNRRHAIPRGYQSNTELLAEAQPDMVHICTPPATHAAIAKLCLAAGTHVLCEKPLCGSLAAFDELDAATHLSGKSLSNIFQWRFGSAAQKLKALIDSGALGELRVAVCHTLWYRGEDYYAVQWRASWEDALGGTLMGHGIHLIDLLLWLVPDWQEVYARVNTFDFDIEVENLGAALITFGNGAAGSVISSSVSRREETTLRLDFQKATVEVRGLYTYDNDNWMFTSPDADLVAAWNAKSNIANGLEAQIAATLDALERGTPAPVSGSEARRILEFMTATYKSAFTRQRVERNSILPADPFYHTMRGV